jgi:hypothetical protein
MRSWSKCVIFSRRMKSSSSAGPRMPARSECWLSATGTAWLVVRVRPLESARTRSSGAIAALIPSSGLPSPTLSEAAASVSVLAVAAVLGASCVGPGCGAVAISPYSSALLALNGIEAASSLAASNFAVSGSRERLRREVAAAGPLTVLRALLVSVSARVAGFAVLSLPAFLDLRVGMRRHSE